MLAGGAVLEIASLAMPASRAVLPFVERGAFQLGKAAFSKLGQKSLLQQAEKTSAIAVKNKVAGNIVEKQYTKSNLRLGQQMHKSYKLELHNPSQKFYKEFRLPSRKRIDFLDAHNNIIYEMKPNNPRAIMQGQRQLRMYQKELEIMPEYKGVHWQTILDLY